MLLVGRDSVLRGARGHGSWMVSWEGESSFDWITGALDDRVGVWRAPDPIDFGVRECSFSLNATGDGLKRRELVDGTATTLIWDGSDYLGEKS